MNFLASIPPWAWLLMATFFCTMHVVEYRRKKKTWDLSWALGWGVLAAIDLYRCLS